MNEPVAYMCLDVSRLRAGHCADKVLRFNRPKQTHIVDIVPLYPKREWVGLTDEEIQVIHETYYRRMGPNEFARLVEAKLKEKNNAT
jgi:hypothetical protein